MYVYYISIYIYTCVSIFRCYVNFQGSPIWELFVACTSVKSKKNNRPPPPKKKLSRRTTSITKKNDVSFLVSPWCHQKNDLQMQLFKNVPQRWKPTLPPVGKSGTLRNLEILGFPTNAAAACDDSTTIGKPFVRFGCGFWDRKSWDHLRQTPSCGQSESYDNTVAGHLTNH